MSTPQLRRSGMTKKYKLRAKIILASGSRYRTKLLKNAGVKFKQINPNINERNIRGIGNLPPKKQAEMLAVAKAKKVSKENPDMWVIGCDQILGFKNKVLHKPKTKNEAKKRLLALSNQTHYLHSAVVLIKNEEVRFTHVETAKMKMKNFSEEYVEQYMKQVGDEVMSSVGAYQVEAQGIQLFKKIEGDMFSIIGLPIIPLLNALRKEKVIDV